MNHLSAYRIPFFLIMIFTSTNAQYGGNHRGDSTTFQIYLDLGLSYNGFNTILGEHSNTWYFSSKECTGYHLGLEWNKQIDENLYYGADARFEYLPTKVFLKYRTDFLDILSFNENAQARYSSIMIVAKIGFLWKQVKPSAWYILFPYPFIFTYCELFSGIGKTYYSIDQYVLGSKNNTVYTDALLQRIHRNRYERLRTSTPNGF